MTELWPEIQEVSQTETTGFATDISVNGDRIFVAEGAAGPGIYQIDASGSALNPVGRLRHGRHAIRKNALVIANGYDGLLIRDPR